MFSPRTTPAAQGPLKAAAWEFALQDYPDPTFSHNIVGMIEHGARLGYSGPLRSEGRPFTRNQRMEPRARDAIAQTIDDAVRNGFTRFRDPGEKCTFSPIGAVPKSDGGFRMIMDLSWPHDDDSPSVNEGISLKRGWYQNTSIEPLLAQIADIGPSEDWVLWKLDLRNAYRHIMLAMQDTQLLAFHFEGRDYVENAINFGGSSSPFTFNYFAEGFHWILLLLGLRSLFHFLDDFFGLCRRKDAPRLLRLIACTAEFLGFAVAKHKSAYGPCLDILGIRVDTVTAAAWLPDHKLLTLQHHVSYAIREPVLDLDFLRSLVGSLQAASYVCPTGKVLLRSFFDLFAEHKAARRKTPVTINSAQISDLRWWRQIFDRSAGVRLLRPPADAMHIWTDAATSGGLGGHLGPQDAPLAIFRVRVPERHSHSNIMVLEALAVLEGLRRWAVSDAVITCHIDNIAVMHAVRTGRIKHRECQRIIRDIFTLIHSLRLAVTPVWTASADNSVADALSRQTDADDVSDPIPAGLLDI